MNLEVASAGVAEYSRRSPDNLSGGQRQCVALADLPLRGIDGVEIPRKLPSASLHTNVIIPTSHHRDEHTFPALRAATRYSLIKDARETSYLPQFAKRLEERQYWATEPYHV